MKKDRKEGSKWKKGEARWKGSTEGGSKEVEMGRGRKQDRKERRRGKKDEDGWLRGRMAERKDGREEGRKDKREKGAGGRKEGRTDGRKKQKRKRKE